MINTKDYAHVYEKLSDGFKANYFGTLEEFKNYIESNFYYVNDYTINHYSNEGNIYIYYITLKDYNSLNDENTMDKTFNIRLGEGTDFEISFNVTNIGERSGKEVVQIYSGRKGAVNRPDSELRAFKKTRL